ncbi:MAG TPA: glycoside hydrolase family 2 TIM barrel-domain containing protein [Tepidisphaeraceae bacterium]|jgi:beta-mannosidase|nr:glycoside hydrolase family 2 TIM barrel-domain containing protein [Tepidisphaeraceae bacterium]
MQQPRTQLTWQVAAHATQDDRPTDWIDAVVPGAVQLDWARAQGWPTHVFGENWRQYDGLEDRFWTYRTVLPQVALQDGQRLIFICGGVDYRCQVLLGDRVLVDQEGMFTPIEIDLTDHAPAGATLYVRVFPAPKSYPDAERKNRDQANRSCKPAVSYGWDFHPRIIPLGIWKEAYLETRPRQHLREPSLSYTLNDALDSVAVRLSVELAAQVAARVRWRVTDAAGIVVVSHEATSQGDWLSLNATIESPKLWWPHDQGEPVLYTSVVELLDDAGKVVDARSSRIGFRRVRLVMNAGAWDEPSGFPKGRSTAPIQLEINGRPVFGKGSNMVGPDIFHGAVTDDTYREQLTLVKQSNMNLLRMWGGAAVQKRAFFDLCDEMGIMVWQEFPLACNNYPDDAAYLRVLDQESRSILRALYGHPSVVIWCGGNELFNAWSGMTDQSLALRLLNRNCYDYDPQRPFLPTSPVFGMGHGHYTFRDARDGEAWSLFQNANHTAYTEFGMPGPADVETLKTIIPADELFPPRAGTSWESHHAFKAWEADAWLNMGLIEMYFGESDSLADLVAKGQLLQAEGYKGLFEEARRQKPAASMALNWCFNEPWPTAANNSLLSWPCKPKPALAAVAEALRPVLASARISKYLWREGEWFDPELWMLSDAPQSVPAGRVEAFLASEGTETLLLGWDYAELPANTNLRGPRVGVRLPYLNGATFDLLLRVRDGGGAYDSRYRLAYRSTPRVASSATRTMNL